MSRGVDSRQVKYATRRISLEKGRVCWEEFPFRIPTVLLDHVSYTTIIF